MPNETPPDALDEQTNKTLDIVIAAYNTAITKNAIDSLALEMWLNLIRERRLRICAGYYGPDRANKPKLKVQKGRFPSYAEFNDH